MRFYIKICQHAAVVWSRHSVKSHQKTFVISWLLKNILNLALNQLRTQGWCIEFAARHYLPSQTFYVASLRAHQDHRQRDFIETMGQEVLPY